MNDALKSALLTELRGLRTLLDTANATIRTHGPRADAISATLRSYGVNPDAATPDGAGAGGGDSARG